MWLVIKVLLRTDTIDVLNRIVHMMTVHGESMVNSRQRRMLVQGTIMVKIYGHRRRAASPEGRVHPH